MGYLARIAITGLLLQVLTPVWCQDSPHDFSRGLPVQHQHNRIQFPGDSSAMMHFFGRLQQLLFSGQENLNLIHFGGSHVQADVFTGRIRERLSGVLPGTLAGRGLIFPYSVAKTNNPANYQVRYQGNWEAFKCTQKLLERDLGLTGMEVTTKDSAARIYIKMQAAYGPVPNFSKVTILHEPGLSSFSIRVSGSDSLIELQRDTVLGITSAQFSSRVDSICLEFFPKDSTEVNFRLQGVKLENRVPGLYYHAVGVNGAGTYSYLKCLRWAEQLYWLKPDLVVFGIGINDAAAGGFSVDSFKTNYRRLIAQVREANPNAAIILITNNDSYRKMRGRRYAVNPNGLIVQQAMFELAAELGLGVWDQFAMMGGLESMRTWELAGLARVDKVHFSFAGYRLLGDLLFSALLKSFENYLSEAEHG
jgi:lysophospholipase L1-like esterase